MSYDILATSDDDGDLGVVPVGHPGHDDAVQVLHHRGPVLACLGGGAGHQLTEVAGRNLSMHFKTFHLGIF